MASRIKNMTEGKPLSLIFTFALPLMIGNVFQQLYTVVDTMVVGRALGVNALAALGAADWMNWMMLGIVQGLTQGFGILMAQKFGAGMKEDLRKVIGNSAHLSLISSLILLPVGQLLARPVLGLLQTPAEIIDNALLYLRIMYLGIPVVMAYNLLACILRSLGDSLLTAVNSRSRSTSSSMGFSMLSPSVPSTSDSSSSFPSQSVFSG